MFKKNMKPSFVISLQPTKFKAVANGDWQKQMSLLASCGYEGIELAVRDPEKINKTILQKTLNDNRLKVSAIGTGQAFLEEGLSFSDKCFSVREKAILRFKAHIELAKTLNTQVIIGLIRGNDPEGRNKKSEFFLKESCRRVCDYAKRHNILLAIEPINRYETCFLNTIDETINFIRQIGYKRLKILPDTFHMNIEEKDICLSIEKAKNYISHFHFADSNRKIPGAGHIDFRSIITKLYEIGYGGFISAEILASHSFGLCVKKFIQFIIQEEERVK